MHLITRAQGQKVAKPCGCAASLFMRCLSCCIPDPAYAAACLALPPAIYGSSYKANACASLELKLCIACHEPPINANKQLSCCYSASVQALA